MKSDLINDSIFIEDMNSIIKDPNIPFHTLEGKTILVTGATGVIGFNFVSAIIAYNKKSIVPIKTKAIIRELDKARTIFGKDFDKVEFILSDICDEIKIENNIDYIIHGASITKSRTFVEYPVQTIFTAIDGTKRMLELAKKKKVSGFVYLSSMEVYGSPDTEKKIYENSSINLDTMNIRTSYSESKRMCENICCAYGKQYDIPVFIMRLTQTFGPGVTYNDERIFAEFARSIIEKRNIVLHTAGLTKRNYLYTADAVRAIFIVLLLGKPMNAYNVGNEDTYCSIYEMARLITEELGNGETTVKTEEVQDDIEFGYAPTQTMNLDVSKLKNIGWTPSYTLVEMYKRMLATMVYD